MSTVLVVDDDAHIRDTLRLVLTKAGYHPLLAKDGQEAIDLMKQDGRAEQVATLLCDLDMPAVHGSTLIAHFHEHYPLIPIIVMSGAADAVFLDALVQQGIGDWIRKPASAEEVVKKVRVAARLHGLRQTPPGT